MNNRQIEKDINVEDIKSTPLPLINVEGLIQTVNTVPTGTPKKIYEQVKIYFLSANTYLYIYDGINNNWKSTQLN